MLLTYNAFGLITVTREKITVNVTAISGKRAISRSINVECALKAVEPGETVQATFGAWIEPAKDTRITFHEQSKLKSGEVSTELSEVSEALSQALVLVKKSAFGD